MAQTQAEQEAELAELYERRRLTAGLKGAAFSDQSTTFDNEALDRRIASLEASLAAITRGSSTRYAATSKGC